MDTCEECEVAPAAMRCEDCDLLYCQPCGQRFHTKGNRAKHTLHSLLPSASPSDGDDMLYTGYDEMLPPSAASASSSLSSRRTSSNGGSLLGPPLRQTTPQSQQKRPRSRIPRSNSSSSGSSMNAMMMTTMMAEGGGGGAFPPQISQGATAGAALAQQLPPPGVLTVNQNNPPNNNTDNRHSSNCHPRAFGSSIGLTADFQKPTTTTTTTSKAICTSTSSSLSVAHPQMKWSTNDFTVGRPLGRGKFGNVYLAKENRTSKPVALKVIFKNTLTSSKSYNLLRREVEIQIRYAIFFLRPCPPFLSPSF